MFLQINKIVKAGGLLVTLFTVLYAVFDLKKQLDRQSSLWPLTIILLSLLETAFI